MSKKPIIERVKFLEEETENLHRRVAILSLIADLLAARGIITQDDIEEHVNELTKGIQQQAGSQTS